MLRGEAGIGKSALLAHLAGSATGCRVSRVSGVESEVELAFAGLHQLCAPVLDHMPRLPAVQREAITTALGLRQGQAPDRFLVGLAVLGLLSDASQGRPVVWIVDDAQWLDSVSAQVLGFVARRLLAEPVGLVFAIRDPGNHPVLDGLPQLVVEGLRDADARAFLNAIIPGQLDEGIRERIVAEARGNPLALRELPRGLPDDELAGAFLKADTRPVEHRIEDSILRRLRALPHGTQRFLVTVAAEPVGDSDLLWRAAERLGVTGDDAVPAEMAGLIELGPQLRFLHPLMRAASYRAASPSDRREAHRALAAETDPDLDPDRRAWHRAQAAVGPDEAVASELERSAGRARRRGGVAAAAAFLARATEMTPDRTRRGSRALAAAQAKFDAASLDAASELVTVAERCPLDPLQRAHLTRLRGQVAFALRRGSGATALLLEAARQLDALHDDSAGEAYLEAMGAAVFAGREDDSSNVVEVAAAIRTAPQQPPGAGDLLLDAVAGLFTDGFVESVPALRRAIDAFRAEADRSDDVTRGLWLSFPLTLETAVHDLWDYGAWRHLSDRAVQLARDVGALSTLPVALAYQAGAYLFGGDFAAALTMVDEAEAITAATGNAPVWYAALVLSAWRGSESGTSRILDAVTKDAAERGEGRVIAVSGYVSAVLHNGHGRYETALRGAVSACQSGELGYLGWSLAELVEAASRAGSQAAAMAALERLEERTVPGGSEWALGVLACSRALVSKGDTAESSYVEAIERLELSGVRVHLARAHLVYGEWLRRENRRVDARDQLKVAYAMLTDIGAAGFAERARRELAATGEKVRKRTTESRYMLTAQERQVAQLAAAGATNPEIGSQLFISPRTVEYHLHKVFAKLDISSRRELRAALATPESPA